MVVASPAPGPVRFEDILRRLGPSTRWHIFIFLVGNMPGFFAPFHNLSTIFVMYSPDHWCSLPDAAAYEDPVNASLLLARNWTDERVRKLSIPLTDRGGFEKCRMYDRDYSAILSEPYSEERWGGNASDYSDAMPLRTVECTDWIYDRSQMESTIVTQWDLVCGSTAYAALAKSAYMIGMFFGSAIYGYLSDKFGRRKSALISLVQYLASAFLLSVSPNYIFFFIFRTSTGMAAIATYLCGYIVVNETVDPEVRGVIQVVSSFGFSLGMMAMPGLAYFLREWKMFNLAGSFITLIMFLYIWVFPESPRWLILQGRLDEAKVVLQRIARTNRNTDTSDEELTALLQQCYDHQKKEQEGAPDTSKQWILLDLLRTSAMRKNTIICCYLWAAAASGYYGLSYSSPSFGSSIFLIVFITGCTDLPIAILGAFAIKYMRRRTLQGGAFLLAGAFCLVYLAAPRSWPWLGSTIALTGRFFATMAFVILYVVTAELFPTSRRNVAMGVCSALARVGAIIAPFITDFLGAYNVGYAMAVFGGELIVAGLLCFVLKETGDKSLPETEADVKNLDDLVLKDTVTVIQNVKY